eukprot:TRINITY_DN585_c0_g1_i2.p1 TRINITY_DN585_c0_g1~~TRINITY_DN585_c0_g1_i2.p1  ORF type:complete len:724 (+),score=203.89 TRINITY_DN585_c0_g1_i2:64-2235(+)
MPKANEETTDDEVHEVEHQPDPLEKDLEAAVETLISTKQTTVSFAGRHIGPILDESFAHALAFNKSITSLNLGDTLMNDWGMMALSEALRENASVKTLNLNTNQIGCNGAKALAACLGENCTLTSINLFFNRIGTDGATALLIWLENNSTLQELNLNCNSNIDERVLHEIDHLLERNRTSRVRFWSSIDERSEQLGMSINYLRGLYAPIAIDTTTPIDPAHQAELDLELSDARERLLVCIRAERERQEQAAALKRQQKEEARRRLHRERFLRAEQERARRRMSDLQRQQLQEEERRRLEEEEAARAEELRQIEEEKRLEEEQRRLEEEERLRREEEERQRQAEEERRRQEEEERRRLEMLEKMRREEEALRLKREQEAQAREREMIIKLQRIASSQPVVARTAHDEIEWLGAEDDEDEPAAAAVQPASPPHLASMMGVMSARSRLKAKIQRRRSAKAREIDIQLAPAPTQKVLSPANANANLASLVMSGKGKFNVASPTNAGSSSSSSAVSPSAQPSSPSFATAALVLSGKNKFKAMVASRRNRNGSTGSMDMSDEAKAGEFAAKVDDDQSEPPPPSANVAPSGDDNVPAPDFDEDDGKKVDPNQVLSFRKTKAALASVKSLRAGELNTKSGYLLKLSKMSLWWPRRFVKVTGKEMSIFRDPSDLQAKSTLVIHAVRKDMANEKHFTVIGTQAENIKFEAGDMQEVDQWVQFIQDNLDSLTGR